MIAGKDKTELRHNRVLELALIRLVEIVGEASAKVSVKHKVPYFTSVRNLPPARGSVLLQVGQIADDEHLGMSRDAQIRFHRNATVR